MKIGYCSVCVLWFQLSFLPLTKYYWRQFCIPASSKLLMFDVLWFRHVSVWIKVHQYNCPLKSNEFQTDLILTQISYIWVPVEECRIMWRHAMLCCSNLPNFYTKVYPSFSEKKSILKNKATDFSKTFINFYQSTCCDDIEGNIF